MERSLRATLLLAACLILVSCGGGGGSDNSGGGSGATFSLDTQQVSFSATALPNSLPAPSQATIQASVSGTLTGTLYIVVEVGDPALVSVTNIQVTSDTTGQADVIPVAPDTLAAGTHTTTLTVRACVNSPACSSGELVGSPRTVTVEYLIAPPVVDADVVAPGAVAAGSPGRVILRGTLAGASSVAFGGNSATTVTTVSDTEVHAGIPALPAGSHAVTVNGGSIPFTGELQVTGSIPFAPAVLPYPAQPQFVHSLVYDPIHQALLVTLVGLPPGQENVVTRYQYAAGNWGAPVSVTVPEVVDSALAFDSSTLYVLSQDSLRDLDAVTLGTNSTSAAPGQIDGNPSFVPLTSIALLNNGNAVVTAGNNGGGPLFFYSTQTATFSAIEHGFSPLGSNQLDTAYGVGSTDGSRVLLMQRNIGTQPPSYQVLATDGSVAATGLAAGYAGQQSRSAINGQGTTRIAVLSATTGGGFPAAVYNASYQRIGTLPSSTTAVVVSPDGALVYALDESGVVQGFDSSGGLSSNPLPAVGGNTDVENPSMSELYTKRMAITPDGNTLFITTAQGIVVIPTP